MSRFSDRLRHRILNASTTLDMLVAQAQFSVYLARMDDIDASIKVLAEVRRNPNYVHLPEIAAQLNIAEAVICSRRADFEAARSKAARGHTISKLQRESDWETGAWLAHFCHVLRRDQETLDLLNEVFSNGSPESFKATFRACLTLADYLHSLDQFSLARRWYFAARQCAERLGDDAATSELLYNISAYGTENSRFLQAERRSFEGQAKFFEIQAQSAMNYFRLVGTRNQEWQFDILLLNVACVRGDFSSAAELASKLRTNGPKLGRCGLTLLTLTDALWSETALSGESPTDSKLEELKGLLPEVEAPEELALVHFQLSRIYSMVKSSSLAKVHGDLAEAFCAQHRNYQREFLLNASTNKLIRNAEKFIDQAGIRI